MTLNLSHDALIQEIHDCFGQGRFQDAIDLIEAHLQKNEPNAELLSKMGTAYILSNDKDVATTYFQKSLALDPNFVPALSNSAILCNEQGDYVRGLELSQRAYEIDNSNIPLHSVYAASLRFNGDLDQAINVLKHGIGLTENNLDMKVNLASLIIEAGEKEGAGQILKEILNTAPHLVRAHGLLSDIIKYDEEHDHLKVMTELSHLELSLDDQIDLQFALGKAYEDCKNYEQSFTAYKKGNDLYRSTYQYDVAQDEQFFNQIKQAHLDDYDGVDKYSDLQPIFIIGMPRSGTSLVEQILASHSDVCALGELNNIVERLYSQSVENGFSDLQERADDYITPIKNRLNGKVIFTDKMPTNFRYVGYILNLFPNAKFIHCRRDPIDVCFSIYKKKFTGVMGYAQSFDELSAYYKLYESLMDFWQKEYPKATYDLSYERLIDNTEEEIRSLVEFCDLSWQNECLKFNETKRAVITASNQQVRQPIYKDAVQYWKNYEPFLGALISSFSKDQ